MTANLLIHPKDNPFASKNSWVTDEQTRIKKLLVPAVAASTFPIPETSIPLGLSSSVGSIQKSSAEKLPQYSPKIEAPRDHSLEAYRDFLDQQGNVLWNMTNIQIRNDELTAISVQLFDEEVQADMERLQKLNEELKTAVAKHVKSEKDEKRWGIWQNILQYFVTASSIVLGAALIATGVGVAAGALLIAAGGIGLVNQIMTDTGAWKTLVGYFTQSHEMQEKIASRIQAGMFFLSLALSLTGGGLSFQAGALTEIATLDRAMKVLTLGSSILNAGSQLAKGAIQKRSADIKAKIIRLIGESTDLRYKITRDSLNMQEAQKVLQENVSIVKKAIEYLEVSSE